MANKTYTRTPSAHFPQDKSNATPDMTILAAEIAAAAITPNQVGDAIYLPVQDVLYVTFDADLGGDLAAFDTVIAAHYGRFSYPKSIASSTNSKVAPDSYQTEIVAAALTPILFYVETKGDNCIAYFDAELSGADQTTLTTTFDAHLGAFEKKPIVRFSGVAIMDEVAITSNGSWQDLGYVVVQAALFALVADLHVCIALEVKCDDGAAAELARLRLVDDDGSTVTVLQTTPYNIADTATAWACLCFDAKDVAPVDDTVPHRLRLEGDLSGSTSASVRRATVSLVEDI